MLKENESRINQILAEDIRQLRSEIERLEHQRKNDKNNYQQIIRDQKKQNAAQEKQNYELEEIIFTLAETGEISEEVEEVIERVEKRKGIKFKKAKKSPKKTKKKEVKENESVLSVEEENKKLKRENRKLRNQMDLDSTNSSLPPSSDEIRGLGRKSKFKGSNRFNERKKSNRKKGAQKGHPAHVLTEKDLVALINEGKAELLIEDIGEADGKKMITRYVLDVKITPVVREVHVHADTPLPKELHNKVNYGNTLRSIAVLLEVDGLISIEKTRDFLNYLSGDVFSISTGTVYKFLKKFQQASAPELETIINHLRESKVVYTDSTKFKVNGKASYVRNHSTDKVVFYLALSSKKMEELKKKSPVLMYLDKDATLVHDHEVGLYLFLTFHGECLVHFGRDLRRIEEETGHKWAAKLRKLNNEMIRRRRKLIEEGITAFSSEEIAAYEEKLDSILDLGWEEYKKAVEEDILPKESSNFEKCVLARFNKEEYRKAYTRFLYDFNINADNNLSERDLRKIVVKRKQITSYRSFSGLKMFCSNLSVVETIKREGTPLFNSIYKIFTRSAPSLS